MIAEYLVFVTMILLVSSMLGGFFDTDFGSPIPWMAATTAEDWYTFEIDLKSLQPVESEVPFGKTGFVTEAVAEMKEISFGEDDGEHTIPFWACGPLQEIAAPLLNKRKGPQFVRLQFRRTVVMRKGKENSIAEFAQDVDV